MKDLSAITELRAAHISGTLSPGLQSLVEAYDALNGPISEQEALDQLSGACLESEACAQTDHLFEKIMSQVEAAETRGASKPDMYRQVEDDSLSNIPAPLQKDVARALAKTGWKKVAKGIETLTLSSISGEIVEVFKIAPGAEVPRHTHYGHELSLVLAGGFTDENGSYEAGDVILMGPDAHHTPKGDPGEPCYLISVRDGDILFSGWLGWAQTIWNVLKRPFKRAHP